jgi:hypothetical protein
MKKPTKKKKPSIYAPKEAFSSDHTLMNQILPHGVVAPPPEVGDTVDMNGPGWLEVTVYHVPKGFTNWPGEGFKDISNTWARRTRRVHGPVPKKHRALRSGRLR